MTKEQLKQNIFKRFPTYSDFIEAYNKAGGDLTHPVLSNQLSGARGLSKFSGAAYHFFFMWWDLSDKGRITEYFRIDVPNTPGNLKAIRPVKWVEDVRGYEDDE